jgi:beta-galactosidase
MRQAGFNTIRAWLVWGVVEKSEGLIDYEYINDLLEIAGKNSLQVGLLFHLHGCPEWAIKKYPQYYYVSSKGMPFEPSQRGNTPSGGWPGLCYDHAEVQEIESRFISSVVKEFSGRREVAFWEPMNEPHMFTDVTQNPPEIFCYCQATREKFRLWLENKYGNIDSLNKAWGRHHNSFNEVRPPTWRFGYSDYMDWRLFSVNNLYKEVKRRTDIIRSFDDKPVIAHSWGGGSVSCPQLGGMAFDDWKNAKLFDMWGYSAFPTSIEQSLMVALGTDACRSASDGKEFWQSELGSGECGGGLDRRGRPNSDTLAAWTWESIRHGAKGLLYWQYRNESQGFEFGGFGLTYNDGSPTDNLKKAAQICETLQVNEEVFRSAEVYKAQVGILFSLRSYFADWFSHRNNNLSVDCLSGYYRMFWEENIPVDILHEDHISIEKLKQYKLIVIPQPCAISLNACEILKKYVFEGGVLFSDPYFCPFDEQMMLDKVVPGAGFHKIFGCREENIYGKENVEIIYNDSTMMLSGTNFREVFTLDEGKPVATYRDGQPAIVYNTYGTGKAFISGINLGLCYSPHSAIGDDILRNEKSEESVNSKIILTDIVRNLGISAPVKSDNQLVKASLLINSDNMDDVLIAINYGKMQCKTKFTFHQKYRLYEPIYNDVCVDNGEKLVEFDFKPCETKVWRMRKS